MSNPSSIHTNPRVAAYAEVRRIVGEHRGGKLFDHEADALMDAASDMVLAADSREVQVAQEMFDTEMDRLEADRWAEMIGTAEQPGTATKLRRAFAGCAPEPLALAA